MRITDPRKMYWNIGTENTKLPEDREEMVRQWQDLAQRAADKIAESGIPVRISDRRNPLEHGPGAIVNVHPTHPFGVTLDWELQNEFEEAISNEEISPEARTARYRRRIIVREIMLDATLRLLHTAGFITMKDHEEGDYYHYRVIAAPGDYPC